MPQRRGSSARLAVIAGSAGSAGSTGSGGSTASSGYAGRAAGAFLNAINVTPLVDVCLVLLIIFMVVTPMLRHSDINVQLPETVHPPRLAEAARQLVVAVRHDGTIFLDSTWSPAGHLGADLRVRREQGCGGIVVKADRRLPYRVVREVMRQASEAGFARAGLLAERLGSN